MNESSPVNTEGHQRSKALAMPTTTTELLTLAGAVVAASLLIMRARRRARLIRAFAPMVSEPPPSTVDAVTRHRWLPLRHKCITRGIDPELLERAFNEIRAAFAPQQVDYSNTAYGKNHWKLSCFMQYSNGVAASNIDLAKGEPLLAVCGEILELCDGVFLPWWETLHPRPRGATREAVQQGCGHDRFRDDPWPREERSAVTVAPVVAVCDRRIPTEDTRTLTGAHEVATAVVRPDEPHGALRLTTKAARAVAELLQELH